MEPVEEKSRIESLEKELETFKKSRMLETEIEYLEKELEIFKKS